MVDHNIEAGDDGEGVRRRLSRQYDEEDAVSPEQDEGRAGSRIVVDDGQPQRVCSSVDTERRLSFVRAKKRKSDEMMRGTDGTDGTDEHRDVGGPSIGTRAAAVIDAPSSFALPPRSPPAVPPAASRSRSRGRGLSLRSSLFTKHHDKRNVNDDAPLEMQSMSPSAGTFATPQSAKKGNEPSVTVPPVYDRARSSASPALLSSRKDTPGLSALPNYQQWAQRQANRHLPVKRMKEVYKRVRKWALRIQEIPPSKDGRHIVLDPTRKQPLICERTGRPHISNIIRSSKYTIWNFLPRQLFAQFSKLANFYFLTVAILQMIPGLSTTGTYTTLVPLLFFVSLSMAKEGYEDLRRHRLDKAENHCEAQVLRAYQQPVHSSRPAIGDIQHIAKTSPIHWAPVKWQSLLVGDVVKLERDDAAPADLVLLRSTGANNLAYIETMALDGETNLKPKQPSAALISTYSSTAAIAAGGAEFVVEDPNLDLYNFEGKVVVHGETAPLTNNEIMYRGSVLRNTPEIIGMIIHSGEECKIRMNANKTPRIKAPSLQVVVNRVVMVMVCFVIFLSLFNSIAYTVWQETTEEKAWYLTHASVPFGHVLTSFIIMFNTLIPLSLYVSMEIIKVAQMLFLNTDIDMYDEKSNTPLEARTSTINEELGQVSYIFSDKTGTLTENVMRFRKLSVAGTAWLHDADLRSMPQTDEVLRHKKRKQQSKGKQPIGRVSKKSASHDDVSDFQSLQAIRGSLPRKSTSQWSSPAAPDDSQPTMSTLEMVKFMQRRPYTAFAKKAKIFILSLALCHTCLPERDEENISYQAASPDELALVQAASELGYVVYDRDIATLTLKTLPYGESGAPVYETYETLDVIEFSSKRKRMSVIVRFPDGRVCLMCKGADSVIVERLRLARLAKQKLAEVEQRVDQRRSLDARAALHRRSSQIERQGSAGSFSRTSMQLPRPSLARPSIGRLGSLRDEVDEWLHERERDVTTPRASESNYYTPRTSAHFGRKSTAEQSLRSDIDDDNALVDDTLAQNEPDVLERCFQHTHDFATEGLRTLLYGYRFLVDEEYHEWKKVYHEATTSLANRQRRIEEAGEMIEQQLELGGATAIEDKLQQGVPETIDRLRRANIHMWMLTGDKRETAINIGHSCRLIKDYSSVTVLDHEAGDVEQVMAATTIQLSSGSVAHSVVVVDGQTLTAIDSDPALHLLFLDLAILADSVICCRASPSQKAGLIHAIRKRVKRSVTLAIGDGANDIAMIQEAHVGIGITGKEGLQAARVSDYSIAQFRFLTKLLLVHGRWNYIRTCKYTVSTFWKEAVFYLTQALFQQSVGYTGTSLYESWSLTMFNTLFTSLVVIFLGIFEQDLRSSTLIAVPELYTIGQRSGGFNLRVYLGWMFMAASEAVIIYYVMWGLYGNVGFTRDQSLYPLGSITYTVCVIVIATKLQVIEQRYRTYMAAIGWISGVGGWFLWQIILAGTYSNSKYPEYYVKDAFYTGFGRNALWWLTLLIAVTACLAFETAIRALKNAFFPTDVEIFQALESDLGVCERFEEASAAWLQAGWQRGMKKSSVDLQRDAEVQAKREGEVQELLERPRTMEESRTEGGVETEVQAVMVEDGPNIRDMDVQDMLARRFGDVKRESLVPP